MTVAVDLQVDRRGITTRERDRLFAGQFAVGDLFGGFVVGLLERQQRFMTFAVERLRGGVGADLAGLGNALLLLERLDERIDVVLGFVDFADEALEL